MAHTKASGSRANQGGNVAGKRLGVKKFGGEKVTTGMIILKQKGNRFYCGKGTFQARDFTIHAGLDGVVKYTNGTGHRRGSKVVVVTAITSSEDKK